MADLRKIAEDMVEAIKTSQPLFVNEIYKAIRKDIIRDDALAFITNDYEYKKLLDDFKEEEVELADAIAERLVYDKEFDCNLSYWENISKIQDEVTTADIEPDVVLK